MRLLAGAVTLGILSVWCQQVFVNSIKAENRDVSATISADDWSIAALVRFEQCCEQDRQHDDARLVERDRRIWRDFQTSQAPQNRRCAYHFWLQRVADKTGPDAGRLYQQALLSATLLLAVLGLLSGVGLAASALVYDGLVPVNVALFLGLLVAPQVLLLIGLMLVALASRLAPDWLAAWYQPPWLLLRWLQGRLWSRFVTTADSHSGEARDKRRLRQQVLQQAWELHRPLLLNRLLRLMQVTGIAFNLGVLGTLLVLLAFTDRAFGWQSSMTTSTDAVESLLAALALPWSWLPGAQPWIPDAGVIAATHIQLGAAPAVFDQPAYRAWWPFLLMTVLVYGLLPRLLVWGFAIWREHRLLAAVDFDGYHYQALWRRMQSVDVQAQALTTNGTDLPAEPVQWQQTLEPVGPEGLDVSVLADALSRYSEDWLLQRLPTGEHRLQVVASLREVQGASDEPVWLVIEGWQPPIEEFLAELAQLAQRLQALGCELHLLLLGKPAAGGSKPVTPRMAEVWGKKLDLLMYTHLHVHADSAAPDAQAQGESL